MISAFSSNKIIAPVAIVLGGLLVASGIVLSADRTSAQSFTASQTSQWTQPAGLGISVPACSSSSPSITCSGSAPSVTLPWTYGGQHGSCDYVNISITGGPSWTNQSCTGSVSWSGAANNTTYNYNISWWYDPPGGFAGKDWIDPPLAQIDSLSGSFSTPNCAAPSAPTVTLPTHASITSTGATLGATVTSDGGAALTARGTCWATTSPGADNCVAEGGLTTGLFSHARTGMPAGTTLYYRGYASNSVGTGYSATDSFTTSAAPQPDLIISVAPSVNSGTLVVGQAITFKGTVQNDGNAVATDPTFFNNRFEIDYNNDGSINKTIGQIASSRVFFPGLAAGGGSQQVISDTWIPLGSQAGNHRLILCADQPFPAITESNDESNGTNNNCAESLITVVAPPTATLTANPLTIVQGQSSALFWSSTNATSCTGTGFSTGGATTNPPGGVSTGVLNTPGTYDYQVYCTGGAGDSLPDFASVEVVMPNATISANPARVVSGNSTTLTWSAEGVESCVVSGPSGNLASGNANGSNQFSTGSPRSGIVINAQSTFTITCQADGPEVTASVVVNIQPSFEEF